MIEIIPKPVAKLPRWFNIVFYLSLVLLFLAISSYFVLNQSQKKSFKELQDLEEAIALERTPQRVNLEKEILLYQKKIDDFTFLFNNHLSISKFFDFLEKNSHPRVWLPQINLIPGQGQLIISGQTESFKALGQQLLIFKKEPLIKDISLTKISIGRRGEIEFSLNLSLDQKIFTPHLSQKGE